MQKRTRIEVHFDKNLKSTIVSQIRFKCDNVFTKNAQPNRKITLCSLRRKTMLHLAISPAVRSTGSYLLVETFLNELL